ncbi:NrtA/SsuA/CpmA family ABC transporter substrate-binding protein [Actinoplanes couchii]|uniref:Sulfonate ABC transporter substrate-binding protein n=1 Tax=Actinoplanes couchii TaxID=403638 RepID=A0ABQ3XNH2_9ACTN|nr:NrtA/SsuA/CpmA family ABC transporter substrate-binding protein [Actinoplanes couchii]MDR6318025.1 sulfonate transport system substrate-binding protein [Actinoplanes couchii]GID60058.1 sulfonate ABC transporter substrate-binding protein [Actinoplanes couchii]
MRISRRIAVVLPLVLALAACGSGNDADSAAGTVEIRIPDPGNAGILALGKKDGSLDVALGAVNAKVAWTGSSGPFAPAAQAINANQLDVSLGSITSGIGSLAANPGFKLFATGEPDGAGEGILVKKDSAIQTVNDLVGKKVAVNKGGTGEYLLLLALKQANIPVDQVERVYLAPDQSAPAFNSGQVDAWATWSAYSVAALAQGNARQVVQGKDIKSDNYTIWAVRTGFVTEHPEVVKALYGYLNQASTKLVADPTPYLNVFKDTGPQSLDEQAKQITADFWKQGRPVQPIGAAEIARYDTAAQFFADQKVTTTKVDVKASVLDVESLTAGTP